MEDIAGTQRSQVRCGSGRMEGREARQDWLGWGGMLREERHQEPLEGQRRTVTDIMAEF